MVAPLGPVRAEALIFTLVKPPAGPCTTTCESTVSPRAPDKATEESVPGASVFPTLFKLGATQALKFERTPLPAREIVVGELVALLATITLPVTLPVLIGAKVTSKVVDWPGARMVPEGTLLALNPVPEALTLEMVRLAVPEFLSVAVSMLLLLVSTFPKLKVVGLTLSAEVAALTVSVAALLVTLPAVLLTTTVNCAPLSAVAVAGVA